MGLGDLFRRRRERESALPPSALSTEGAPGSFADSEGRPVVGRQVDDAAGAGFDLGGFAELAGADLGTLAELGPMIQRAIAEGNVEVVEQSARTMQMQGTELREEIFGIMREHGLDPETGAAQSVDAADYAGMQQQILAALARHGIDPGAAGAQVDIRIDPDGR